MRVNKNDILFTVVTNESGKIVKISDKAMTILKNRSLGDDVFDFIDADTLRKLSMYDAKTIHIKTTLKDYPNAFLLSKVKNGRKVVEIFFMTKEISLDEFAPKTKEILSLYGEREKGSHTLIDALPYLNKIVEMVMAKKNMQGTQISLNGESNEIKINQQRLELLILTSLSIMNDINFKSEISINSIKDEISFEIDANSTIISDINSICIEYPQATSKLHLLRAICEDEGITFKAKTTKEKLIFTYNLEKLARRKSSIKAFSMDYESRIALLIDTLF